MSDNVCTTKRLHVNAYVKASGMSRQPPMILSLEVGKMPKELPGAEMHYLITGPDGNSIELVGCEGALVPIAILQDALHRESVLKSIRKPLREQLQELMAVIDKMESLMPYESTQDGGAIP